MAHRLVGLVVADSKSLEEIDQAGIFPLQTVEQLLHARVIRKKKDEGEDEENRLRNNGENQTDDSGDRENDP